MRTLTLTVTDSAGRIGEDSVQIQVLSTAQSTEVPGATPSVAETIPVSDSPVDWGNRLRVFLGIAVIILLLVVGVGFVMSKREGQVTADIIAACPASKVRCLTQVLVEAQAPETSGGFFHTNHLHARRANSKTGVRPLGGLPFPWGH